MAEDYDKVCKADNMSALGKIKPKIETFLELFSVLWPVFHLGVFYVSKLSHNDCHLSVGKLSKIPTFPQIFKELIKDEYCLS